MLVPLPIAPAPGPEAAAPGAFPPAPIDDLAAEALLYLVAAAPGPAGAAGPALAFNSGTITDDDVAEITNRMAALPPPLNGSTPLRKQCGGRQDAKYYLYNGTTACPRGRRARCAAADVLRRRRSCRCAPPSPSPRLFGMASCCSPPAAAAPPPPRPAQRVHQQERDVRRVHPARGLHQGLHHRVLPVVRRRAGRFPPHLLPPRRIIAQGFALLCCHHNHPSATGRRPRTVLLEA